VTGLPFDSVLVANRGEIAVRIIRTVRALGLRSLVVFHDVDAETPAVAMADEAIRIDGPTPVAAYLDGTQILQAAKRAGAGAIHPGYGFLSENATFARATAAAGLIFVGPTPEAIDLMGDKIRARDFVAARGFPVAPSATEDDDPDTFLARARAIGMPLLVKPSAGGGGKGMRIVRDLAELAPAVAQARGEARRYFGDGRLYAERYVERPRHIEVQVLGDAHGNVVHLFERECSVQRRFQKIIEETPSTALTPALRARICDTAAGIARAAEYRNAGTVEFILGDGEFYFLEMNTRLQVEHPVTEMTTGLDLVAEQLHVAAGRPLPFTQTDLRSTGHAIELRLYAEAPDRGRPARACASTAASRPARPSPRRSIRCWRRSSCMGRIARRHWCARGGHCAISYCWGARPTRRSSGESSAMCNSPPTRCIPDIWTRTRPWRRARRRMTARC
jgi:acetyl-CoA/propionyl-CoA carboxylase biotin carboxyl carrier protein